jgi:hypothetical protein
MRAPRGFANAADIFGRLRIVPRWIAVLAILLAIAMNTSRGLATNGTWIGQEVGATWEAATDWSGGRIADGTDGIADFSTLNITSDITVGVDLSHTIGSLVFGDTTPSNDWNLVDGGPTPPSA